MTKKLTIKKQSGDKKGALARQEDFTSGLMSLRNAIDDMFDDGFWKPFELLRSSGIQQSALAGWIPKADISETEKEIRIKMNLPGVDSDDVNIEIDDNTLMISGSTQEEKEEKGEHWYRSEREYGEFRRIFELPTGADVEQVSAKAKNGVLRITIPKKPEAQTKKISVDIES